MTQKSVLSKTNNIIGYLKVFVIIKKIDVMIEHLLTLNSIDYKKSIGLIIGKLIYKTENGDILIELSPGLKGWTGGTNSLANILSLNLSSNKQHWWAYENTVSKFNSLIMNTE